MARLMREPWCYTPEQVARLTHWQISEVIYGPAVDESRRQHSSPHVPTESGEQPKKLNRGEWIGHMIREYGGDADHWGKMFDEIEAGDAKPECDRGGD